MTTYRHHDHHKRRIALWIAVVGTMSVIIAIWAVVLPIQLEDSLSFGARGLLGSDKLRQDGEDARKTFAEGLKKLEAAWTDAQRRELQAARQEKTVEAVDGLKSKIYEASATKISPPQP